MTDLHCRNCGLTVDLVYPDGYTVCCNDLPCDGRDLWRYGNPNTYWITSCCWAAATVTLTGQGLDIPDGSSRLGPSTRPKGEVTHAR